MRKLRRIPWEAACLVVLFAYIGAAQQVEIQTLVTSGSLEGMRWPNFSDYRNGLREFYEPAGFTPAWVQGQQPVPQALSLIELFKDAGKKGLDPEDYDASRWDERILALRGSSGGVAVGSFDVALTVCTMRFISDLHIGRMQSTAFQFWIERGTQKVRPCPVSTRPDHDIFEPATNLG